MNGCSGFYGEIWATLRVDMYGEVTGMDDRRPTYCIPHQYEDGKNLSM